MREWLEYHKLLGVEHFYLYDHSSNDRSREILQPYIDEGLVDLFEWPIEVKNQEEYLSLLQLPVYNHALSLARESAAWAAFIDLDEFLVPVEENSLVELLEEYTPYAGLAINWQIFGTSGINRLPEEGLLIEHLLWKVHPESSINQVVKLVVQPRLVERIGNPHTFDLIQGSYVVDSNFIPLAPRQRGKSILIDKIRIHHYWCGTREWFFQNKLPRRQNWGMRILEDQLEELLDSYNLFFDDTASRFVPALRQAIPLSTQWSIE